MESALLKTHVAPERQRWCLLDVCVVVMGELSLLVVFFRVRPR